MPKIIRSVRDTRGNVIQKQPAGGAGRLKCPRCSGNCTAQSMPNGKRVMACQKCGASYVVGAMSSVKVPQPGAVAPHTKHTHHPARPAAAPTLRGR
jgi:hypothetical protein